MIGIAWKGRPIAGIIGRPFTGQVVWGIVGLGKIWYYFKFFLIFFFLFCVLCTLTFFFLGKRHTYKQNKTKQKLGAFGIEQPKNRDKTRRIVCTSRSHFAPYMKTYVCACNPTGVKTYLPIFFLLFAVFVFCFLFFVFCFLFFHMQHTHTNKTHTWLCKYHTLQT